MEWVLQRSPAFLDHVELHKLQPYLFPQDRILAEMIVLRDSLLGIEHPELKGRLTAHW